MTDHQRLQIEASQGRERIRALLSKEERTAEETAEMTTLTDRAPVLETELRAAIVAEGQDTQHREAEFGRGSHRALTPEERERLELRSRARVSSWLLAASRGKPVDGANRELMQAAGVEGVPIELWEPTPEERAAQEDRAITAAPGTVGINLSLVPQVFAPSIAGTLRVAMPVVPSGTYSTARIAHGNNPADAVAKGAAVPEIANTWTVASATPKRLGASMKISVEDIAAVGAENFEAMIRSQTSLVLSAELDDQLLNGAGSSDDLTGMFEAITPAPPAPAAAVETFARWLAIQASGIEGLWASTLAEIQLLIGPEAYRQAASVLNGNSSDASALEYMTRVGAGVRTNARMPAKSSHIQAGILVRRGLPGMQTAVAPTWGSISIDDPYSDAAKGQRRFVVSTLVGDVVLTQPGAYAEIAMRVSV